RLPGEGPGVDELRQVCLPDRTQLQDPLAHEVEPLSGSGDGGELLRALAGQVAGGAGPRKPGVRRLETVPSRGDPDPIRVEMERRRNPARSRGHRVADPLELDQRSGTDLHRE